MDIINQYIQDPNEWVEYNILGVRINEANQVAQAFPFVWGVSFAQGVTTPATGWIVLMFLRACNTNNADKAKVIFDRACQWRADNDFNNDNAINLVVGPGGFEDVAFRRNVVDRNGREVAFFAYQNFAKFNGVRNTNDLVVWVKRWLEIQARRVMALRMNNPNIVFDVNIRPMLRIVDAAPIKPWGLYAAAKEIERIIADYYPGLFSDTVFVNEMKWSPFLAWKKCFPGRDTSYLSDDPDTVFKVLARLMTPQSIPVEYGGFNNAAEIPNVVNPNAIFNINDGAVQTWEVKHSWKMTCAVNILVPADQVIAWQLRILPWTVAYGVEFIPTGDGLFPEVLVPPTSETPADGVVQGLYRVRTPGQVKIKVENKSFSSKIIMFRFKVM